MTRGWMVVAILAIASPVMAADTESIDAVPPRTTPLPARTYDGAAQHRIAIAVPAWHGLEPALAIAYASSARNGWLGYHVTLDGVSTIERVSARLGVPTYTASDTYLVDGEPMIACVAGSPSPSCMTGGTHTTKHERYARIVKSGTTWAVTSPDGTVDRYTTIAEPIAVLTSRTDTSGNTVTYSYATTNGTSVLSSIAYNGTTITFATEGRPDPLSFATGGGLRRLDNRLKTIAVRTDGALERAYALTYTTGAAGTGSYLVSVREHGSDATFNAAGAVTGGTGFPATSFAYTSDRPAVGSGWQALITRPQGKSSGDESFVADVNGDGRADAIAVFRYTTAGISGASGKLDILVQLGRADGTFSTGSVRTYTTSNAEIGWYTEVRSGDVNGDGKADLVFVYRSSVYACCGRPAVGFVDVQLALGTASGTFTVPGKQRISSVGEASQYSNVLLADFNGDGRSDLVVARSVPTSGTYPDTNTLVSLSAGSTMGPIVAWTLLGGGTAASVKYHAGDVNGDGRDDLVVVYRSSRVCSGGALDSATANAYLSTGDGKFGPRIGSTLATGCGADSYAGDALVDVNGDGMADLAGDEAYSVFGAVCSDCDSDVKIVTNLGNGNGSFGGPLSSNVWQGAGAYIGNYTASFVDINGDGFADRVGVQGGANIYLLVSYGRGNGYFDVGYISPVGTGGSTAWANGGGFGFADVDGDGRPSVVATSCVGLNFYVATLGPSAQFSGLVSSVTLPTGGSIGFDYATSSAYPNGYLPFAFPVLSRSRVSDGRGQTAATTYSYTGGLYVPTERRFFGFATTRITDGTGAIKDLGYTQHVADPPGTIATTHERTSTGALLRYESTLFDRTGNGTTAPYTSLPSRRYQYECNGLATCKSASRTWTYTAYGAVASEVNNGDDARDGDEYGTYRTQVVNPTAFITQLDSTIKVSWGPAFPSTYFSYTELAYDGAAVGTAPTRGLVTQRSRLRDGTNYVVDRTVYDAAGNEIQTIDPLGNTTTKTYDVRHRRVTTTNALGHTETRGYDTLGRVTTIMNPNGGVTTNVYDALGRLVSRTDPDGSVATAAFANLGNAATQYITTTVSDGTPDGLWKRTYIDGLGRTVRTLGEGGITTDTTYDVRGLVTAQSAPYVTGATPVWTTTTYDAIGRPLRVTEPDGAATITTYGNGLVSTTDQRGLVTERYYDGYQQVVQIVERLPVPQTTTIGYDRIGRRIRVTDAKGNTTRSSYNQLDQRIQSLDPDLGLWQFTYDDAGRITAQQDARGVTIEMTYDALGRPLERRSGPTTLATFTYDTIADGFANIGRLTRFTDPTGSTRRDYDAMGRLRRETKTVDGTAYRFDWFFDAAGRVASILYPDVGGTREQVTTSYDASGRVASVGGYVGNIAYDARGNLTSATYGNGATVARTYSPARGWMLGQTVTAGATVRDQLAVTRALSGDIVTRTSTTEPRDAWQFTYDVLGRLTAANNTVDDTLDEAFTYDEIGGRLTARRGAATTTYTYPAAGAMRPHAPLTIGSDAVRYDANGNRLGIGAAGDAIYDDTNRLVDDGTTTYAYDAEGTRVRAGNRVVVRDLFETDGTTSTRYYFLGKERIARRDETGAVAYYHADSIGTVRTLTSDAGAVAGSRLTFAFGELAATTGIADPFGLAGQRRDDSGLYHMGARVMDPAHGQFTQPDPSGAPDPTRPQTLNRYTYVLNNPIRLADPTGFQDQKEKEEKPEEERPRNDPMRVVVRKGTSTEIIEWSSDSTAGKAVSAPRLYSKAYYDQPAMKADPVDRSAARWAFESQTGRLYADHDAYSGIPFETLDRALLYADRIYGTTGRSQVLEGNNGELYRYAPTPPGERRSPDQLQSITPSEVPDEVGWAFGHALLIFNTGRPTS